MLPSRNPLGRNCAQREVAQPIGVRIVEDGVEDERAQRPQYKLGHRREYCFRC